MRDLQNDRNLGALPQAGRLPVKAAQRRVRAFWRITLRAGPWRGEQRRCAPANGLAHVSNEAPSCSPREGSAHARAKR